MFLHIDRNSKQVNLSKLGRSIDALSKFEPTVITVFPRDLNTNTRTPVLIPTSYPRRHHARAVTDQSNAITGKLSTPDNQNQRYIPYCLIWDHINDLFAYTVLRFLSRSRVSATQNPYDLILAGMS